MQRSSTLELSLSQRSKTRMQSSPWEEHWLDRFSLLWMRWSYLWDLSCWWSYFLSRTFFAAANSINLYRFWLLDGSDESAKVLSLGFLVFVGGGVWSCENNFDSSLADACLYSPGHSSLRLLGARLVEPFLWIYGLSSLCSCSSSCRSLVSVLVARRSQYLCRMKRTWLSQNTCIPWCHSFDLVVDASFVEVHRAWIRVRVWVWIRVWGPYGVWGLSLQSRSQWFHPFSRTTKVETWSFFRRLHRGNLSCNWFCRQRRVGKVLVGCRCIFFGACFDALCFLWSPWCLPPSGWSCANERSHPEAR